MQYKHLFFQHSEDIGVVNNGEQSMDVKDILMNKDKFDAHLKEIDLDIQFQSLVEPESVFTFPLNLAVSDARVVLESWTLLLILVLIRWTQFWKVILHCWILTLFLQDPWSWLVAILLLPKGNSKRVGLTVRLRTRGRRHEGYMKLRNSVRSW